MFTGIIEQMGIIRSITATGTNKTFLVESKISSQLTVDQSVSHDGVCLTVEAIDGITHTITAIDETLNKTNLHNWQPETVINLERCMLMNGRLDGHIVQGHVDSTAVCTKLLEKSGSWEYDFAIDHKFSSLIIEKGSICLNGISLTIFNVTETGFTIGIIPYTYQHTNMHIIQPGSKVNIEFDVIGKYVQRMQQIKPSDK